MVKQRILSCCVGLALMVYTASHAPADDKKDSKKIRIHRLKALEKDLASKDAAKRAKAQAAFREDLKSEITRLREAMRLGQTAIGLRRVKVLLPTIDRARLAFRKDISKEDLDKVAKFYKTLIPQDDEALAQVLRVDQRYTQLRVHQASGAELKAYKKGSTSWRHFPGACKRLANSHLRDEVLYYEVEFLLPEASRGIKYHLFFWNGEDWTMLGPVWRVFR